MRPPYNGPSHSSFLAYGTAVASCLFRLVRRAWQLGEPASPVPVFWLAAACMLGGQLHRTIHDVDIFWQLKLGEITLDRGLPRTEPFLAGQEQDSLAAVAWLGQVVFAAVRRAGGWDLLRLFDAVVWLGGYAVVGWSLARRGWNPWAVAIGLWVGWFAAVPFASIRPQTFAVFSFGLLVVLTRSGLPPRTRVGLGTLLLVLWQNLHPSAAVGAVYLAAAAAGEWGWYVLAGGRRPDLARLLLAPVAAAATLATPAGLDIYRISAENRDRCVWEELEITEWLPMWPLSLAVGRDQAAPLVAATAVVVLARGWRRVRAADLVSAVVLTAMTLVTFRFVLFWGMAVIPVWVQCLSPAAEPAEPEPLPPTRRRLRQCLVAAGFLLALLPLVVLPLNFAEHFPFAGVAALKAERVRGPVYCNYFWGGFITDFGYPDWHPTHDGRYYLFTRGQLARHFAAGRGEVSVAELEQEYHPVAFFLRPGADDGLAARLDRHPGWRKVHADGSCVVFVRR